MANEDKKDFNSMLHDNKDQKVSPLLTQSKQLEVVCVGKEEK